MWPLFEWHGPLFVSVSLLCLYPHQLCPLTGSRLWWTVISASSSPEKKTSLWRKGKLSQISNRERLQFTPEETTWKLQHISWFYFFLPTFLIPPTSIAVFFFSELKNKKDHALKTLTDTTHRRPLKNNALISELVWQQGDVTPLFVSSQQITPKPVKTTNAVLIRDFNIAFIIFKAVKQKWLFPHCHMIFRYGRLFMMRVVWLWVEVRWCYSSPCLLGISV